MFFLTLMLQELESSFNYRKFYWFSMVGSDSWPSLLHCLFEELCFWSRFWAKYTALAKWFTRRSCSSQKCLGLVPSGRWGPFVLGKVFIFVGKELGSWIILDHQKLLMNHCSYEFPCVSSPQGTLLLPLAWFTCCPQVSLCRAMYFPDHARR